MASEKTVSADAFTARTSVEQVEESEDLAPKFDADGLIACITTDAESGEVLMLGYMNADALQRTIQREGPLLEPQSPMPLAQRRDQRSCPRSCRYAHRRRPRCRVAMRPCCGFRCQLSRWVSLLFLSLHTSWANRKYRPAAPV